MTIPLPRSETSLDAIHPGLDDAGHEGRREWLGALSGRDIRTLYDLAEGHGELLVEHFWQGEGTIVHHGLNSLLAFRAFEKRVTRTGDVVQGYNAQAWSWFTGPGHFVLRQDGPEVVFDYTLLPPSAPDGFPALASNTRGFSFFVYGNMVDRVRRVSRHCTVGRAVRFGRPTSNYFALVRGD